MVSLMDQNKSWFPLSQYWQSHINHSPLTFPHKLQHNTFRTRQKNWQKM